MEEETTQEATQENTQEVENENLESETETDAAQEIEQDESESEDSETSEESEEEGEEKPKRSGFKKRLDRKNRQLTKAQEEVEYWKQEALKKNQPKEEKEVVTAPPSKGKPDFNDYEDHDAYMEALAEWKVDQRLAAREERQEAEKAKTVQTKKIEAWQTKVTEIADKTPDFEDVMEDSDDVSFGPHVQETIFDSDLGPAILYELAKDSKEALRISELSPLAAIREIGKIEGRIQSSSQKTKTTKTTKAPRPLTPNRGSGKVSKDLNDPNLSFSEYEAIRNKQSA